MLARLMVAFQAESKGFFVSRAQSAKGRSTLDSIVVLGLPQPLLTGCSTLQALPEGFSASTHCKLLVIFLSLLPVTMLSTEEALIKIAAFFHSYSLS